MNSRIAAVLSIACLVVTSLGCASVRRRQDRAVDADLRAKAVRIQRKGRRPVTLGAYELVKVQRTEEPYTGEGSSVGITINGNGREISQHRVAVTVRHAAEGRTWTGRCRSRFQREGLAVLDGVLASQSTQLSVSCTVDDGGPLAWRFSAKGLVGSNLEGGFARSDAGVGDRLRVELQLDPEGIGRNLPMAHVRQGPAAVCAALLTHPERVWLTPDADVERSEACLALLMALRHLPYAPPKRRARGSGEDEDDAKGKGILQIFS
ncbi:MAG: hypothetical protein K0V04_29880 [Deltaproteobacteria bacterium]|nr:hypothetical protein [Deltaproteobacteria bacterium]